MEQKKQGRMATMPTFNVPEIFVDDEDITDAQRGEQSRAGSPLFSPTDLHAGDRLSGGSVRSIPSLDTTVRSRPNSIQMTPTGSPTRGGPLSPSSPSPFSPPPDADWHFASALTLSRPPSPLEEQLAPTDTRSRSNSSVSAADVLEVLDSSAWGESIRRSFTTRRPGQ